jgi:hypothetical protein
LTVWNVVDHGLAAIFFGIAATAIAVYDLHHPLIT